MLPFNRQQFSLHTPRLGNPSNEHLMQPSCRRRMIEARDVMFSGLLKKEENKTDDGVYQLMPLIQCLSANRHLPCATACSRELCRAMTPLELSGAEQMLEIAGQAYK